MLEKYTSWAGAEEQTPLQPLADAACPILCQLQTKLRARREACLYLLLLPSDSCLAREEYAGRDLNLSWKNFGGCRKERSCVWEMEMRNKASGINSLYIVELHG